MTTYELPARGLHTTIATVPTTGDFPAGADALILGITATDDHTPQIAAGAIPSISACADAITSTLGALRATGSSGEITRIPAPNDLDVPVIIAVGLGKEDDRTSEAVRRAAGAAARSAKGLDLVVVDPSLSVDEEFLEATTEGLVLGAYSYTGVRKEDKPVREKPVRNLTILCSESAKSTVDDAVIVAEGVCLTRDLVNTPSLNLYPESYAAIIEAVATEVGLEVEILDEAELEDKGYGGIIAVGKGSVRPPRLVRLRWTPKEGASEADTVAFVGKGITFDTGGISLKPSANMEDMISDMGGSAAVVGTMVAAARLGIRLNITATLPLAENMPSGSATCPGDVITHYGGITSEVLNTDAEGRLVLADALARACEDKPSYLLETATLTGAQIVALGNKTSGVMGSEEFRDRFAEISRSVGEPAWAMPLLEEQEDDIKSPIADIRNVSNSRAAGMLYAGLYLSKFIDEGINWVHVDIAGPSFNKGSASGYTPLRATGVPVRSFIATLKELAQ